MSTENIESTGPAKEEALSTVAVARRRILLKGVGKGAAVLAATVPIQTLAGQRLLTFDRKHQCSVSGMQSGVHSATPSNTPVCGGYSPGWWGQTDWKQGDPGSPTPRRAWPTLPNSWSYATPCRSVFAYSTLRNIDGSLPTLFQVMSPGGQFSNSDEFHWICAWLNALSHSFNFPYSGQEVLDFYNAGLGTTTYDNALAFFKTYMENA